MMVSAGWVGNSALSFTRTLLPSIHHHFPCLALLSLLSPHNRILWICQSNIDRIEILSCKHIAFAIRCKALSKHKDHGDRLRKQLGLCRAFGSCEHWRCWTSHLVLFQLHLAHIARLQDEVRSDLPQLSGPHFNHTAEIKLLRGYF